MRVRVRVLIVRSSSSSSFTCCCCQHNEAINLSGLGSRRSRQGRNLERTSRQSLQAGERQSPNNPLATLQHLLNKENPCQGCLPALKVARASIVTIIMLCIGFFSPRPFTLALTWFRTFRVSFFLFPSIERLLKSAFQFLIDSLQKIKRHNTRSLHSCDALCPNYARFMFIFEFTNRFADGFPLSLSHSSVSFTLLLAELSSHLHARLKMLFSFHKMDRWSHMQMISNAFQKP